MSRLTIERVSYLVASKLALNLPVLEVSVIANLTELKIGALRVTSFGSSKSGQNYKRYKIGKNKFRTFLSS